jgi:hypothetical protein
MLGQPPQDRSRPQDCGSQLDEVRELTCDTSSIKRNVSDLKGNKIDTVGKMRELR